jgi:Flp pilus assembly protein TadD
MAEAVACFSVAARCAPNDWHIHMNLANAYLSQRQRDKAIPELRETLRLTPSLESARRALAKALQ